jgi:hypothetical protein
MVVAACAVAAPTAHAGLCDLLHTCGSPVAPPVPMQPLPAPVPGRPLFDRVDGHLQLGLTERGYDGSPNGLGRAATANQEASFVRGVDGTLLRVPVSWAQAEPDPPVGGVHQYRWPRDGLYSGLVERGVRPILTLQTAPRWALASTAGCTRVCAQPPGPGHAADFAAFAAAVAHRYPLAAAIEIWNEANNHHGSVQGPRPAEYAALLARSYDTIKAARPAMRVLGGSLGAYGANAAQPTTARDMRLGDFLQAMLDNGAASHMDGLSFHPYDFDGTFHVIDAVLAANGDSTMRRVPTEFGISTDDASQTDRSDELQSLWHKLDARGDVDAAIFHTDITAIAHDHYGWLAVVQNRTTFHPYRVWCDFARLLAGQQSCPATIRPSRSS